MTRIHGGRYRFTPPRDKVIRFPPSPRDNFQNYAGLRGQNDTNQPYPAFLRNNKPSTCSFNFAIGTMVASWRFSPVNRYSCDLVAFSNTPNPAKSKKARPPHRRSDFQDSVKPSLRSQTTSAYICSGAETPTRVSTKASVTRTASQAARRARESSGSTGRPSLGRTWQAA